MSQQAQSQAQGQPTETSHFASFVLRCWRDSSDQIRARLVDVHSGISHPLADLAELPDLIHDLLAQDLRDSGSLDPLQADAPHIG